MRVLRAPEEAQGLHLPSPGFVGIQDFLVRKGSGLRYVRAQVPLRLCKSVDAIPTDHSVAMWVGRVAKFFGVSRKWLLTIMQAEQGLVTDPVPRNPDFSYRRVAHRTALDKGEKALRTRGGWLAVKGEWKMLAACGYAIPDPGEPAYFDTERYIGLVNQVYHAARWTRARVEEYRKNPHRAVMLYGGERVECGDVMSYLILRYTPNESEIAHRMGIFKSLFG